MRENLEPELKQVNCLLEQKKERSSEDFNKKSVSHYNVQNWTQKKNMESESRIWIQRKTTLGWDIPGSAVVKTPHLQCRGPGFDTCSGN